MLTTGEQKQQAPHHSISTRKEPVHRSRAQGSAGVHKRRRSGNGGQPKTLLFLPLSRTAWGSKKGQTTHRRLHNIRGLGRHFGRLRRAPSGLFLRRCAPHALRARVRAEQGEGECVEAKGVKRASLWIFLSNLTSMPP